jgi:DNA-binding transcriptional LysR family regulator
MRITMTNEWASAKIDLHLVLVLKTLLATRSVSKTAVALGMHQPGVSLALKRLRELTADPILVRSGSSMVPTSTALAFLEPADALLHTAQQIFLPEQRQRFEASTFDGAWRIAASDYLDPLFLPLLVARLKRMTPLAEVQITALGAGFDYSAALASGMVDLVIGNWLEPPADLHIGRLIADEVVCMVAADHPSLRRGLSMDKYLAAEHVAPAPLRPGALGVVDQYLHQRNLKRRITVTSPNFSLIPQIVARSLLVLTTGRQFCSRFVGELDVRILACPIEFPALRYYQLWHDRVHRSPANRWLRETVKSLAMELRPAAKGRAA